MDRDRGHISLHVYVIFICIPALNISQMCSVQWHIMEYRQHRSNLESTDEIITIIIIQCIVVDYINEKYKELFE